MVTPPAPSSCISVKASKIRPCDRFDTSSPPRAFLSKLRSAVLERPQGFSGYTSRLYRSMRSARGVPWLAAWPPRQWRLLRRRHALHSLLCTEMIVAAAIVRGDVRQLLDHDAGEHPVALQLGGCNPSELAKAARIGTAAGYAEINLNVGCPSDRVQNGSFGACLMLKPALVADCVRSLRDATHLPVTVKCRIGIDRRDDYAFFRSFADTVRAAGIAAPSVHARGSLFGRFF